MSHAGEKRKRKLQQLQQLLDDDDDDPNKPQTNTRSTSPYEDRSYSGSVGYERSVTSSSPNTTTVSGNFESPQFDHRTTVNQTWSTPIIPSIEQPLAYAFHQPVAYRQPAVYSTDPPATTSYSVWNTRQSSVNTGFAASDSMHPMIYSSHTSPWPSPAYENFHAASEHQQMAGSSCAPPATSWQDQTSGYFPTGIVVDSYGRRYYTYNPS